MFKDFAGAVIKDALQQSLWLKVLQLPECKCQ